MLKSPLTARIRVVVGGCLIAFGIVMGAVAALFAALFLLFAALDSGSGGSGLTGVLSFGAVSLVLLVPGRLLYAGGRRQQKRRKRLLELGARTRGTVVDSHPAKWRYRNRWVYAHAIEIDGGVRFEHESTTRLEPGTAVEVAHEPSDPGTAMVTNERLVLSA